MKNNYGLVDHCKRALREKWGYVQGTYGKKLTEKILVDKIDQLGDIVLKHLDYIKKHYMGKRTADCVNLPKGYVWWDDAFDNPVYDVKYDKVGETWLSADGMFEVAKIKGVIDSMPEIPGILLWKQGHIGVYIGGGQVIEAKGTKSGVVQTPLKGFGATKWTHWLLYPHIEYVDEVTAYKAIIQEHVKLDAPEILWDLLDKHPYAKDLYRKLADSYKR